VLWLSESLSSRSSFHVSFPPFAVNKKSWKVGAEQAKKDDVGRLLLILYSRDRFQRFISSNLFEITMGFTNALFLPLVLPAALAFQSFLLDRRSTIRTIPIDRYVAVEFGFQSRTVRGYSLNTCSLRARLRRQAGCSIDNIDDFRVLADLLPGADVKSIVRRQVKNFFCLLERQSETATLFRFPPPDLIILFSSCHSHLLSQC